MRVERSELYKNILFTAFWVYALFGFISNELLPFMAGARTVFLLFYDATIVSLGLLTLKKKEDIFFILSFIVISFIFTCNLNGYSFLYYINGLRDFITFLFIIPIFRYFFSEEDRRNDFIKSFDKQLYMFLVIQVPCVVWQFIKYGANDHGGGSLGNWNSGVVSTLIYLISFYLIQKHFDKNNYIKSLWENKRYIILLFPTFLNETKVSFVFLIMYFFLLIPIDRKIFIRVLAAIPIFVGLVFAAITLYLSSTGNTGDIFSLEYYMEGYLMDDESEDWALWLFENGEWSDDDVPRFTKILYLSEINEEYPGHVYTGFGVGLFKGGTIMDTSDFYIQNEWFLMGTVPYVIHILMQLGLVGLIWIIVFWVVKIGLPRKDTKRNLNLQLYIIFLVLIIFFYNDTFRNPFMSLILLYVLENSFESKGSGEPTEQICDNHTEL